jgi:hypothetical protein
MSTTSRSEPRGGIAGTDHASLNINAPDTYHGDRKKPRAFLAQVDMYIRFNTQKLGTAESKVMFAATYLRDAAFDWFEPYLKDQLENHLDKRKADTKIIFASIVNFKESIRKVYGGWDEERTAEREL